MSDWGRNTAGLNICNIHFVVGVSDIYAIPNSSQNQHGVGSAGPLAKVTITNATARVAGEGCKSDVITPSAQIQAPELKDNEQAKGECLAALEHIGYPGIMVWCVVVWSKNSSQPMCMGGARQVRNLCSCGRVSLVISRFSA